MSGHKRATVTISQEEYRRLYAAEQRAYYQAFEIPEETLLPVAQASQSELSQQYERLVERQERYAQTLQGFQRQLREAEQATAQRVAAQQADFYGQMLATAEQAWQGQSVLLEEQAAAFETQLRAQQAQWLGQVDGVQAQINSVQGQSRRAQAAAQDWLRDAAALFDFVNRNYPPALLDGVMLDGLGQQIVASQQDLAAGLAEASLGLSQPVFLQLAAYRVELEQVMDEELALAQSAAGQLAVLRAQCVENAVITAMGVQGETLDQRIDADYWSGGQLHLLLEDIEQAEARLQAAQDGWERDALAELGGAVILALAARLGEALHAARRNALNAQLRYNTAQLVMRSLVQQGYRPEFGRFDADDQRNGYLAAAIGPDGSQVEIRVEPSGEIGSQLEIIAQPGELISEAEMRRRALEIMRGLQPYGLEVGAVEEVVGQLERQGQRTDLHRAAALVAEGR
jgi:hypothetical protein